VNSDQHMVTNTANEIDLVELVRSLWGERYLIAGITSFLGLIALLYVFLAIPEYEVQSYIRPASAMDLDEINSSEIYTLTPEEALKKVGASLESYDTRMGFFKANSQLFSSLETGDGTLEQAFRLFSREQIEVLKPDPKKPWLLSDYVGVQIKYLEGMDGVSITNGLVEYAIETERKRTKNDVNAVIANRMAAVQRKIDAARASYMTDKAVQIAELEEEEQLKRAELEDELHSLRENLAVKRASRILQLEESIRIAKSAGILKPNVSMLAEGKDESAVANRPLHFMGTSVLQAELDALKTRTADEFSEPRIAEISRELILLSKSRKIEILKTRKDDDLFLSKLSKLKAEEAHLKSLKLNLDNLVLVRIDQPAEQPLKPLSPKKLLTLAIALVAGGMLGVFAALLRVLFRRNLSAN
jgi:chain length determinant protein (polysaccharide antigen chain regulator)